MPEKPFDAVESTEGKSLEPTDVKIITALGKNGFLIKGMEIFQDGEKMADIDANTKSMEYRKVGEDVLLKIENTKAADDPEGEAVEYYSFSRGEFSTTTQAHFESGQRPGGGGAFLNMGPGTRYAIIYKTDGVKK